MNERMISALLETRNFVFKAGWSIDRLLRAIESKGLNLNVDLEGSTFSEIMRYDLAYYLMYMTASDGLIRSEEVEFINILLDFNSTPNRVKEIIIEDNIYSLEFENKLPKTFEVLIAAEALIEKYEPAEKTHYLEVFLEGYRTFGEEIAKIDGDFNQTERLDLDTYVNMLQKKTSKLMIGGLSRKRFDDRGEKTDVSFEFSKSGTLREGSGGIASKETTMSSQQKTGLNPTSFIELSEKDSVIIKHVSRKDDFECDVCIHHVKKITLSVPLTDFRGKIVSVKVLDGYCPRCGRYYLPGDSYKELELRGFERIEIVNRANLGKAKLFGGVDLEQESILHSYGYNVGQRDNLSDFARHHILRSVINEKVMTKRDCMMLIRSFITRAEGRTDADMSAAISKWRYDLAFLSEL